MIWVTFLKVPDSVVLNEWELHGLSPCEDLSLLWAPEAIEVMRTFGQYLREDDLVNLMIDDTTLDLMWLASNYLYFVIEYRENCSPQQFQQFLLKELATFKRSKFCDENLPTSLGLMINLFGNSDQQ